MRQSESFPYTSGEAGAATPYEEDDHGPDLRGRRPRSADGAQGTGRLGWFAGDPTDLVITDICVPEIDGIELIMRLRETFPEVPVIAMSGGGVTGHRRAVVNADGARTP